MHSYILLSLFGLIYHASAVGFVRPLEEMEAYFLNTELPSIYSFHFELDSGIRDTDYIRVKFANYTTADDPTCLFDLNSENPDTEVECTSSDNSVYVLPGESISSSDEVYLTIFLSNSIPDSPGHTQMFEVSTESSTDPDEAIIFDINPGYAKLIWEPYSETASLFVEVQEFGTDETAELQGAENDISLLVRFSRDYSAEQTRLVIVVDAPWTFDGPSFETSRSPLYEVAVALGEPTDLYLAPNISEVVILNNNMIEVYFDERFVAGREFILDFTNIINPISIGSGYLRFFATDYTSSYVIERNEETVQFETAENTLPIEITLASGIPFGGPVALYKDTEQYVRISFTADANIPAGSTIEYEFPSGNTLIRGTLYVSPSYPDVVANDAVYGTSTITLADVGEIELGDTYFIQQKVLFSRVGPDFIVKISIIIDGVTVKYGESEAIILETNADTLLTHIRGSGAEDGVIEMTGNQIELLLSTSTRSTTDGSALYIYANKYVTGTPTCLSACVQPGCGTFDTCDSSTNSARTLFELISFGGSNQLEDDEDVTVTITGLTFQHMSNHQDAIYEFYFQLDYDGTGDLVKNFMIYAFVRPDRDTLPNFEQYHLNSFYSNNEANYPSFIRLFGDSTTLNGITVGSDEQLFLTISKFSDLENFLDVSDTGDFPCGSNLDITCYYYEGNTAPLASNPIDWNRVVIFLPDSATSNDFNLFITQFLVNGIQDYEFIVGKYHEDTYIYETLYIETAYQVNPGQDPTTFLTATYLDSDLRLELEGQYAGVEITSTIQAFFKTPGGYTANSAPNYGAATILIASWDFWIDSSVITNVGSPLSSAGIDETVFLSYTTTSGSYLRAIIWPMIGTAATAQAFLMSSVEMPYSLDTPDHILYVTDQTGQFSIYNEFINGGRNALSINSINQFKLSCEYNILGYLNTYCELSFVPNARIDLQTKMKFIFNDAFVSISDCAITYQSSSLEEDEFSCDSNLKEILLSFDMDSKLDADVEYTLSFYGLDHGTGDTHYVDFTIFDADFGYEIEDSRFNYYLELENLPKIVINRLTYEFTNLDSISNLKVVFSLPRDMEPNEVLEVDIGSDLQGSNRNTGRLSIKLQDSNENDINIVGAAKSQIIRVELTSGVLLEQGSYILRLDNIRTPSTHSSDEIFVRLKRKTDDVFVLDQSSGVFTQFPALSDTPSANVSIASSRFFCVGCYGEFTLQVTLTASTIDENTDFYLHFPSYFLPALSNEVGQVQCLVDSDPISCETDSDFPYRLKMSSSPLLYDVGDTFELTVYGFTVTNNDVAEEDLEDLFFAIDALQNGEYSEQTFIALPDFVSPDEDAGSLFFYDLDVTSTNIKEQATYTFLVNTSVEIAADSVFVITFDTNYDSILYVDEFECSILIYVDDELMEDEYANTICDQSAKSVRFDIIEDIPADATLEITIVDVPNPNVAVLLNPNKFQIGAYDSTQNNIVAFSVEGLNSAFLIDFTSASSSVSANGGGDIVITAGTYSESITIGTVDGSRFLQDVSINTEIDGFTFDPQTIEFFVGDISQTFRVGCNENVKVRAYPLDFAQSEVNSLSSVYGNLFNLRIVVTNEPEVITIPSSITVYQGANSLPSAIEVPNSPYTDVEILVIYDEAYFNGAFGIDVDYSSPAIEFKYGFEKKYLAFFATDDIVNFPTTFEVELVLDGTNYESYTLSRDTVEIVVEAGEFADAEITGTQVRVGKTLAEFDLNPSVVGSLIFQLTTDCLEPLGIDEIKKILRNNGLSQVDQTIDGCTQRFFHDIIPDAAVNYNLTLEELVPETNYTLYIYIENLQKDSNTETPLNFNFTTLITDNIVKMRGVFNTQIFIDQLNDLICFLLRLFETRIVNVVDAQGFSCSPFIEPTSRFLSYNGSSYSNFAEEFIFYLLPDPTLENDSSTAVLPTMFDNNVANGTFFTAAEANGITFLESFEIVDDFSQAQAFTSSDPVNMPSITNLELSYQIVEDSAAITLADVELSTAGQIYAVARQIANIVTDPEDEFSTIDVTIRVTGTPTPEQIYNCTDSNDQVADSCARVVVPNENEVTLFLTGLQPNAVYKVFYVLANEYPIDAILDDNVVSEEVRVLSGWVLRAGSALISLIVFVGYILA